MNKRLALALICIFCCTTGLHAQSRDVWLSGGLLNSAGDARIGNSWVVAFRLALNAQGPFGHEFQYTYSQPRFNSTDPSQPGSASMEIHQAGYNFLFYLAPRESAVRPTVTAGVHLNDFVLPGSVTAPHDISVKFGFNVGAGLKIRLTPLLGLRADVRQYETPKPNWGAPFTSPGGLVHQTEASAGLGIYF